MFACHKCKKQLSSKQALHYHMSSKRCVPTSSSIEKMRIEADIIIQCTLDGHIQDYNKKGTPLRCTSVIGKSMYDLLKESCKYEMSLQHIKAIAYKRFVFRIECISVEDIICRETRDFSCILLADETLEVYLSYI